MSGAIVGSIAAVAATGGFQRDPIAVEKNILQSHPEETVPGLAAGVGEIKNRRRRTLRSLLLVSNMLIKERNGGSNPLHQGWLRVRQHPNITQPIIFRVVVGQGVA